VALEEAHLESTDVVAVGDGAGDLDRAAVLDRKDRSIEPA
jgi:hypothetical protein